MEFDITWAFDISWPFLFASAVLYTFGQVFKKNALPPETGFLSKILWMTLPVHPILFGCLLGLVGPVPSDIAEAGKHAGILYYAGAGFFSVYGHDLVNTWLKYKKQGEL